MTDATFQPGPDGAAPHAPARPRGRVRRFSLHLLALVAAIIAALLVAGLSIDLGPAVKSLAENQATKYLNRPFHIGRLSAKLSTGVFVFENVVIEGTLNGDTITIKKVSKS